MTEPIFAWSFEAGSIQAFLFDTGRLADAVGASLLVDRLTGDLGDEGRDLLSSVLKVVDPEKQIAFSRRGGGSFLALCPDRAVLERARLLWQAALLENAPGLRWSDGLGEGPEAQAAARQAMDKARANRAEAVSFPLAGPLTLRTPRTGLAAVPTDERALSRSDLADASTVARRRHQGQTGREGAQGRGLLGKFCSEAMDPNRLQWPRNMEREEDAAGREAVFPFVGEEREVAFIHADGNGLGAMLIRLQEALKGQPQKYIDTYSGFSRAISQASIDAARTATEQVLWPVAQQSEDFVMPARPLVLGGDDLSIIVRADLALEFTAVFLEAFEQASEKHLRGLKAELGGLDHLSAAAGVVFVKANFPFAAAAELSEHLCGRAKTLIKREAKEKNLAMPASALAFQRITASLEETDLPTAPWQNQTLTLGLPAYVLGRRSRDRACELPLWKDLQTLSQSLQTLGAPRGPARRWLMQLHQEPGLAAKTWQRMHEWAQKAGQSGDGQRWQATLQALSALRVPEPHLAPVSGPQAAWGDAPHWTPWPDALLVRDFMAFETSAQTEAAHGQA
jgi:hypothetical protein